ncbi:hypothetical protein LQ757_00485 [Agromyces sp. SYSU K20354]|uniref:hypothetical protein n=1 Tax=Agromyces cavernae TaxID=2898659 RepID=UPI001E51D2E5|nr:hypothetical protein [Agromyces cavernae]MCD2440744.1 hypothetical protein [Agromyces cavernae]
MNETVTITPWNAWPLIIPAVIAVAGIVISSRGTRHHQKGVRELGTSLFLLAVLAGAGMFAIMPGAWDQGERRKALESIGYTSPTFSAEVVQAAGEAGVTAFQAERDGKRVRGVIKSLGGDQWEVEEIEVEP